MWREAGPGASKPLGDVLNPAGERCRLWPHGRRTIGLIHHRPPGAGRGGTPGEQRQR